jgi:hypothetical protein
MRWVPSAAVGVIAFTNLTYGGYHTGGNFLSKAAFQAIELLARTGGLAPRRPVPAPALLAVQSGVERLLATWDDAEARRLSAENFFLDTPVDARRKEFQELRARHGACRPEGALEAENALRGRWTLRCERGTMRLSATVAPTGGLQELEVTSALALEPRMGAAVTGLLALAPAWSEEKAAALLAPSVDRAALRRQLAALAALHGTCRAGEPVDGDGRLRTTVPLSCEQRPVTAALELDGASGRITSVRFGKPEGATCPD